MKQNQSKSARVIQTLAAAAIALGITLAPRNANTYSHGTMEDPSIHPLLVDELMDFYGTAGKNSKLKADVEKLKQGSIDEDSPPYYIRSFNHFMDFETGEGIFGFASTSEWATSSELQSGDVLLDKLPPVLAKYYQKLGIEVTYPFGDHSWERVVESYKNSGTIGEDFGHVFHLISDMTVPAHVRNDPHWGEAPFLEKLTSGSYFQVSLWPTDSYEVWTDDNRNEIMPQVNPQNVPKFNTLEELMQDLAYFTGSNFYSDGEIISVLGLLASTNHSPVEDMYKIKEGKKVYFAKDIEGKEVRLLRKGILTSWTDDTCLADYWSVLGTKAIEYGAAALEILAKEEQTCSDKCSSGETKCSGDGWKLCGDYDGNGCVEWGDVINCDADEYCESGECVSGTPTCEDYDFQDCYGNEVWWFDSCGNPQEWIQSCDYGCNNGQCEGEVCTPDCSGKECGDDGCGNSCGGCGGGESCENGTCVGSSLEGLCEVCESDADCVEGMYCYYDDNTWKKACVPSCFGDTCPNEFSCGGMDLCVPYGGLICTSSTEASFANACGQLGMIRSQNCDPCDESECTNKSGSFCKDYSLCK
ncbi:hypothetical protein HZC30_08130 [Candidatus Woesearchaeota archaeon]|nr:hypothetical protein [Candidatus Woesearchaeota archaeon]